MKQPTQTTPEQLKSALRVLKAIADAIREAGAAGLPSGQLYAVLMGVVDASGYDRAIATLKNAGIVRESGNVLFFVEAAQ